MAKVTSDYPIEENKKIRFKIGRAESSETPIDKGKQKKQKKTIEFSAKTQSDFSIGKKPIFQHILQPIRKRAASCQCPYTWPA